MTNDFIQFFSRRCANTNKTFIDEVEHYGKLVGPIFNEEKTFNLINGFNNPLVFIDMCQYDNGERIRMNVGFLTLVQKFNIRKSVLYSTPTNTGKTKFINAFILYKLLTEDYNIVFYNSYGITYIVELYNNLPEYMRVKSLEDITSRIYNSKEAPDGEIGLVVYDDIDMNVVEDIDKKYQTIVMGRVNSMTPYRQWLIENRENREGFQWDGISFTFQDIGLGKEYFLKQCEIEKFDLSKIYDDIIAY